MGMGEADPCLSFVGKKKKKKKKKIKDQGKSVGI